MSLVKGEWKEGWRPACVAALPGIFIMGIFFGDVWLGKLMLPASMMVLPFFFWACPPTDLVRLRNIPAGVLPLLAMASVVAVQIAVGMGQESFPLKWKSDLAIWQPVAYAGATILAFRQVSLTDRSFWAYLLSGGMLTGLIMLGAMIILPADSYLNPQQDLYRVQEAYALAKAEERGGYDRGRPEAAPTGEASPVPLVDPLAASKDLRPISGLELSFYESKRRVKNFLGQSNYLAVFFVFLFSVALFSGRWWGAALLAGMTLATLSRFGAAFLLIAYAAFALDRASGGIRRISAAIPIAVLAGMIGLFLLQDRLQDMPGMASMSLRLRYWSTGLDVVSNYPLLGAPRSVFLDQLGYSIIWNPHNSALWVMANFGLLGLAAYACYVAVALVEIGRAAAVSRLWTGVLLGVAIMLAWSLVENIVLTPAFEILFAALYVLARNRRSAAAA